MVGEHQYGEREAGASKGSQGKPKGSKRLKPFQTVIFTLPDSGAGGITGDRGEEFTLMMAHHRVPRSAFWLRAFQRVSAVHCMASSLESFDT